MSIVNLATFEIDSSKAQKEMDNLLKRLFELKERQKELSTQSSTLQKEINKLGPATKENASQFEELKKQQLEVFKAQKDLAKETSVVSKEYNSLVAVQKTKITVDGQMISTSEAIEKALNREVKSINDARKVNSELTAIKNQLNPEIAEQKKLMDELNARIDSNTEYIKANSSATERQKMNVGNYQESIQNALGELNLFNGGLTGFIQKSQESGGAGKALMSSFSGVTTGIMGMTKATLTFIATPIGAILAAIVAVLLLVKNAMNQNAEATQKITSIFNVFGSVVKNIFKIVEPFGTWLIDGLAKGFEVAGELAEKAMRGLAAAMEFLGMEEEAKSFNSFTDSVKASAEAAYELAQAEAQLEKNQRIAQKTMLTYQNEAEKLRQIRDDDMKSMPERIKANDALGAKLDEQMKVELELGKQALRTAQLRIAAYGETKEALDALAEAETNIIDIEERITGQRSEQLTNRNALLKEAAEKEAELREKAYENALKRMQDELKLFQEQQGFKSKTLEEEFKIFQETAKRETDILKLQLKNRKISQTEYNAEILRLQNEQGQRLAEIAVENAELELKAYKELNDEKYLENKRFDEELFNYELARQADLLKRDKEFAQLQLDQGVINKTEYNQVMLDLDRQYEEQRNAVRETFEQQRREDEAAQKVLDAEARMLEIQETSRNEFEAQRIQEQLNFEQQQVDLAEQNKQGLISVDNYNKAVENLERQHALVMQTITDAEQTAKLDLMKDTFGGIAELVGENTAMGKAAGIASATINTYQGVSEVWKSPSVFPEPYNTVLKGVQTGITVASGLKAVKQIASVKVPSGGAIKGLATGGIVGDGFEIQRANGDDRLVTLQTEEAVLSRASRTYIGDSMLAAAGVPMSGAASSTIGSSSPMMEEIAIAVEQGAARGSEQGSKSGASQGIRLTAQDRLVQQSATF